MRYTLKPNRMGPGRFLPILAITISASGSKPDHHHGQARRIESANWRMNVSPGYGRDGKMSAAAEARIQAGVMGNFQTKSQVEMPL